MDPNAFATAYALSTSVGIRPFLTLALASLAMHFGYVHPSPGFAFLGTDGATLLLAGLALVELASDKMPVVDHLTHVVHFATKPVAAALLVGGTTGALDGNEPATYALMTLGALNALGVHAGIATVRGASSATTLGIANPFISLFEDAAAALSVAAAIAVPLAGAALALLVSLLVLYVARRVYVVARGAHAASAAR